MTEPLIATEDDFSVACLPEPTACPEECGRAAMIVVNRDGETRCIACDMAYVKKGGRWQSPTP